MAVNKTKLSSSRRQSPREAISPLDIHGLTSLTQKKVVSRRGKIIQASTSGFLIHIDRADLVPKNLRESLSLQEILNDQLLLVISPMELEIGGVVARVKRINKTTFELGVNFVDSGPEFWRECLMDLLPRPGDFEDDSI